MRRQETLEKSLEVSAAWNLVVRGDASVPYCLCFAGFLSLPFGAEEVTLLFTTGETLLYGRGLAAARENASCRRNERRRGLLRESARTVRERVTVEGTVSSPLSKLNWRYSWRRRLQRSYSQVSGSARRSPMTKLIVCGDLPIVLCDVAFIRLTPTLDLQCHGYEINARW